MVASTYSFAFFYIQNNYKILCLYKNYYKIIHVKNQKKYIIFILILVVSYFGVINREIISSFPEGLDNFVFQCSDF